MIQGLLQFLFVVFTGSKIANLAIMVFKNFQNYTVKIRSCATSVVLFHLLFSSRAGHGLRKTFEF